MKIIVITLVLIIVSIQTHAYSQFDTVNVFYVYHKDGRDIGYQKWTGTIQEHEDTQETMKNLLMEQYRLDKVLVGQVYPGKCGVLFSQQISEQKDGKIKYSLHDYFKSIEDAKKFAEGLSENTYYDYNILEVICTPKDPKGVKIVKEGTVTCPNGTESSYKIRKVTNNESRSTLIVQTESSNVIINKGHKLDQNKLAKSVCGSNISADAQVVNHITGLIIGYLHEQYVNDCMEEKSKSKEACEQEYRKTHYKPKNNDDGVRG